MELRAYGLFGSAGRISAEKGEDSNEEQVGVEVGGHWQLW